MCVKLQPYTFSSHWSPTWDTPLTRCKVQARCGSYVASTCQGKFIISFVWFPKWYFQLILCLASCPLGFLCFRELARRAKRWVLVVFFFSFSFLFLIKHVQLASLEKPPSVLWLGVWQRRDCCQHGWVPGRAEVQWKWPQGAMGFPQKPDSLGEGWLRLDGFKSSFSFLSAAWQRNGGSDSAAHGFNHILHQQGLNASRSIVCGEGTGLSFCGFSVCRRAPCGHCQ